MKTLNAIKTRIGERKSNQQKNDGGKNEQLIGEGWGKGKAINMRRMGERMSN